MSTPATRRCTKCGTTKPLDQFYREPKPYKDGSPRYRAQCVQCMRTRALTIYHQVKGRKVRKVSTPLCDVPKPLCDVPRPLTRLPQRTPFRPPPKPSKPTRERHYVVDEYSQVDPNSDD